MIRLLQRLAAWRQSAAAWWRSRDNCRAALFIGGLVMLGIGFGWWIHPGAGFAAPGLLIVSVLLYDQFRG